MRLALLRLLIAAGLLVPFAAHADIATIVEGLIYAAGYLGASGEAVAALYVVAAAVAVYGAAQARQQARSAEAQQKAQYNAALTDRSVTALTAEPSWRIIYGRAITGGDIVGIFTSDKTDISETGNPYIKPDGYKHLVIVFAAHECQAINEVYVEGVPVGPLDGSGNALTGSEFFKTVQVVRTVTFTTSITVPEPVASIVNATQNDVDGNPVQMTSTTTVTGGGFVINDTSGTGLPTFVTYIAAIPIPTVRIQKHLGTTTQAADAYLMSVVPSQWTSTDQLLGLCYLVVTLDLEDSRFQGGPPNITADISGRKVLDTRTGINGWSANTALCIRDFLVNPWGFSTKGADVDTAYCNAAANACDVLIPLTVGTVTTTEATYTCNGVFTTDGSSESVLNDMCEAMGGFAVYGANWQIIAGSWTPPVMDLVDDNLDGQIEVVQAGAGIDEIFNGVRGSYIAADKSTPTDFDPYQNATFLASDGDALWIDITLPYTNNKARCKNIARIQTERARSSQIIKYPAKLIAWPLQIGDRVTVTSAEYGLTRKTYRVTDWQFTISSAVTLLLQEDAAEIYDLADASTADPTPNTGLPNPWQISALTGVTATSSAGTLLLQADGTLVPRVLVQWDAVTSAYVADGSGKIEILYHGTQSVTWGRAEAQGFDTSAYIVGVMSGDYLTIRVRPVNGLGVRGPDVILSHHVYGGSILLGTSQIALGAATEVLPGYVSTITFPAQFSFNALVDPYLITPVVNCYAEVSVVADLSISATAWDVSTGFFSTFADPVADTTASPLGSPIYATLGSTIQYGPTNGATTNRQTYTLTGRFSLSAGTPYYIGLRACGTHVFALPPTYAYVHALQVQVTLVKR